MALLPLLASAQVILKGKRVMDEKVELLEREHLVRLLQTRTEELRKALNENKQLLEELEKLKKPPTVSG